MNTRSVIPSLLGLSLIIGACSSDTTEPNPARTAPEVPGLAVTSNSWITRANTPGNRTNLAAVTLKNSAGQSIVYAIGGEDRGVPTDKVTAYNVATNTWTFRRPLPVPLAGSNGAGVINGKIYVSGGYSHYGGAFPFGRLFMYDPATNTWTKKRDMPILGVPYSEYYPAGNGVTGVINGKLYVVSGCFEAQEPWGYFETCDPLFFRYNPATDRWVQLRSPFAGVAAAGPMAGGVIAGKFYVMAGSRYVRDGYFEVYNPSTNQWTTRTPLGLGRPGAAAAVLGGKLFLMGGSRYNAAIDGMETLAITLAYDPAVNAWSRRAQMPIPRSGIAASAVQLGGQARIEVVGGIKPGNNIQYIP